MAIVQFPGVIDPKWIAPCRAAGVEFHVCLPHYAYLVKCRPSLLESLLTNDEMRWADILPDRMKINPRLTRGKSGSVDVNILSISPGTRADLKALGIKSASIRKTQMGWYKTRSTLSRRQLSDSSAVHGVSWIEAAPVYRLFGERGAQVTAGNYPDGGITPTGPGYKYMACCKGSQWSTRPGRAGSG